MLCRRPGDRSNRTHVCFFCQGFSSIRFIFLDFPKRFQHFSLTFRHSSNYFRNMLADLGVGHSSGEVQRGRVHATIFANTATAISSYLPTTVSASTAPRAPEVREFPFLVNRSTARHPLKVRKGTNGVSTNGVTAISFYVFWQRDLLGTPADLLLSARKCQGVPFSTICRNSLLLQRPH